MITEELDGMLNDINQNKVPSLWEKYSYISEKSLSFWLNDLDIRVNFF